MTKDSVSILKVSLMNRGRVMSTCLLKVALMLLLASSTLQSRLKIVNTPGPHSEDYACAITCVGSTHFSSDYEEYNDGEGKQYSYKSIDVSACGFLAAPIVTVTLDGQVTRVAVSDVTPDRFNAIISSVVAQTWLSDEWDVTINWSAYGYTCFTKCGQ